MTSEEVLLHVDPPVVVVHTAYGTADWTLDAVQVVALRHPGRYRMAFCIGRHTLALGPAWNVDASAELVAALEEFGRIEVIDALPAPAGDHDDAGGSGPAGDVAFTSPEEEVGDADE